MDIRFSRFKLGLGSRLVAAGALYAAAVALQIGLSSLLPGLPLAALAWMLLAVKPVTNKPADLGLEEWRAVSDAEVLRIADTIKEAKKARVRLAGPAGLGVLALVALGAAALISRVMLPPASLAFLDLGLFLIPGFFFGRVSVFIPGELGMKLSGFLVLMNAPRIEGFALTPYLRFDKDKEERDIPEDLRMLLEPKRKDTDLVGVQFQTSINNGANGRVPYMYAVVLTRGRAGQAHRAFSGLRLNGFVVEAGGDEQYGTVVIRQATEAGGYHTDDSDCMKLYERVVDGLRRLSA